MNRTQLIRKLQSRIDKRSNLIRILEDSIASGNPMHDWVAMYVQDQILDKRLIGQIICDSRIEKVLAKELYRQLTRH